MARCGLGAGWRCVFANDNDPRKAAAYTANWGGEELRLGDVAELTSADLPGRAHLAWASFPCQDLSLAGNGAGLNAHRSGTFWPFWRLIEKLIHEKRQPSLVVLENVCGALTSHDGKDFAAIANALTNTGYRFGAVVIDAVAFVPQSRPRLFIIGAADTVRVPDALTSPAPHLWHPPALQEAKRKISPRAAERWIWWKLTEPPRRSITFSDLIESEPKGVDWHTPKETARLLSLMSDLHRAKVSSVQQLGAFAVGGVYKRTRPDSRGRKKQRAEVRFDNIAGCLRTPVGGSSRQTLLIVEGDRVRSRLLSPREVVRLMGLPDSYKLPERYNDAYHLAGDGVVAPVVTYLAQELLKPLLRARSSSRVAA